MVAQALGSSLHHQSHDKKGMLPLSFDVAPLLSMLACHTLADAECAKHEPPFHACIILYARSLMQRMLTFPKHHLSRLQAALNAERADLSRASRAVLTVTF